MARGSTLFWVARNPRTFSDRLGILLRASRANVELNFKRKGGVSRNYATASSHVTDQWKKQVVADKLLNSPYKAKPIPETSFPEFVFSLMDRHRNNTMLINGITGEKFSYHDCLRGIEKVSSGLIRRGFKPGDKVALYGFNQPEYFIAFMALITCGGTSVDINPNYTERELKEQIDATDCRFIFCHPQCVQKAKSVAAATPSIKDVFVFGTADGCIPYSHLLDDDGTLYKGPHLIGHPRDTIAQMPGSSGTTGLPKSVCKSHHSLTAMALATNHEDLTTNSSGAMGLLVLPLYHIFPLLMILSDAIVGAGNVLLPKFVPETYLSAIQKHRVFSMPMVPPLVLFMMQHEMVSKFDLSSLKCIVAGAAPFTTELLLSLKEKFKLDVVRQGYGLTEICPVCIGDTKTTDFCTVGHPCPDTELKVLDVETREQLGPNRPGELVTRNPTQMNEYLNNQEATSKTLDKDGWIYTGDIGYYNEDGLVYVVDRLKDLIKYKGHQVAPAELENMLMGHPAVKDAAVIGIPDERAGELPRAYVVLNDNHKDIVTEADLCKFVADQTAVEKHLNGGVKFIDIIPKSAAGKVLKKDLRALAAR